VGVQLSRADVHSFTASLNLHLATLAQKMRYSSIPPESLAEVQLHCKILERTYCMEADMADMVENSVLAVFGPVQSDPVHHHREAMLSCLCMQKVEPEMGKT